MTSQRLRRRIAHVTAPTHDAGFAADVASVGASSASCTVVASAQNPPSVLTSIPAITDTISESLVGSVSSARMSGAVGDDGVASDARSVSSSATARTRSALHVRQSARDALDAALASDSAVTSPW